MEPVTITWDQLSAGDTGIPVWVLWLQVFSLVDWALGWSWRLFPSSRWTPAAAAWLQLWDLSILEAAAAANAQGFADQAEAAAELVAASNPRDIARAAERWLFRPIVGVVVEGNAQALSPRPPGSPPPPPILPLGGHRANHAKSTTQSKDI